MEFEQTTIFDFLEGCQDEILANLKAMKVNEEITMLSYIIRLTEKGYEIENVDFHIGFLSLYECYARINSKI